MKKANPFRQCVLVGASALLLQCVPVLADEGTPMAPVGTSAYGHGFDWIQHTHQTLDELKGKLNLAPGQSAAWDTWSGGVMMDAHQQVQDRSAMHEGPDSHGESPVDATTPEQMARGIEHLRTRINWMQQRLARLQAAQARTKVFYDALDTNQKTIFDLFWHEMFHRAAGHDGGWGMPGHERMEPGHMMEGDDGPAHGVEPN